MPYIKQNGRKRFEKAIAELKPMVAGDLNYILTMICLQYIGNKNYTKLNEVIGVLECCKLEMYRKVVAPYEDDKILENGDVQ